MAKVVIGKAGKRSIWLDLRILMKTRMLITANSGGGKSWLIRLLAELLFPHVQVIIIDPEGEFASLREKFGYVLVGKGGETAADVRTAELLAHRLLEHKISAVCDIFELKPKARHEWIRVFIEALMEAPKRLWRHVVIIVDEAHKYCPEKGQGESEAIEAMLDLASRGRKRGYCPIFASQRHAKLSKNATAELLNRLVGPTFEEADIDRAVSDLSVPKEKRREFMDEIKLLEEGNFNALGRAISKERILFKVGPVKTSHPEAGEENFSAEPPPPPDKVKALLPKLADLPKEVEKKIATEAELRAEIRTLRTQLSAKPKEVVIQKGPASAAKPVVKEVTKTVIQKVDVPVVNPILVKRIEAALGRAEKLFAKSMEIGRPIDEAAKTLRSSLGTLRMIATTKPVLPVAPVTAAPVSVRQIPVPAAAKRIVVPKPVKAPIADGEFEIKNPHRNILRALREFNNIDFDMPNRHQVAGWLGIKVTGTFLNNLSSLRTAGLIEYQDKNLVLTGAGLKESPNVEENPTNEGLFRNVCSSVKNPQASILKVLYERPGEWVSREDVAAAIGIQVTGTFLNNLSTLHTAGMIKYGEGQFKKMLSIADWMFIGQPVGV